MILVLGYVHIARRSRLVVNEISRNKVVVPEGVAGMIQIISISWVFIYAELLCRAIRHGLTFNYFLVFFVGFVECLIEVSFLLLYFMDLIFVAIVDLYCRGLLFVLLEVDFVYCTLCIRVH